MEWIMKHAIFVITLALLSAIACDSGDGAGVDAVKGSFNGHAYIVADGDDTLDRSENLISGSGSIVFNAPLDQIPSKDNFSLAFSVKDGGSLELIVHSDNGLAHGVSILFDRAGTKLSATLKADGSGTAGKV